MNVPPMAAREQVVEERRPRRPDVERACRAGGDANANRHATSVRLARESRLYGFAGNAEQSPRAARL